jgi:hypothetical protein
LLLLEIVPFHSTPKLPAFNFRVGFQFPCRGGLGEKRGKLPPPPPPPRRSQNFCVQPSSNFADPPYSAASFEVSAEPRTGARPSFRLCVGLTNAPPVSARASSSMLCGVAVSSGILAAFSGGDYSTEQCRSPKSHTTVLPL